MRLLILNWRDVRSRRAGGAELLTFEVARRLVERGHEVTWLSSRPDGLPAEEEIAGIRVLRRGTELTTRFHAPRVARGGAFDLVVEAINTLPYFAPLWSPTPTLLFIHQLARDVWWYEAPLPLAVVGWLGEPVYLQAYRKTPALTVSASTRDDLLRIGLRGAIHVVPMAVNAPAVEQLEPKTLSGNLLSIGRLTPSKRFDHAIEALGELQRTHPAATLTIIGEGRDRERLEAVAARRGVTESVRLVGRIDEEEKLSLLTASDLLVGTSVREGWGLTVTEAASRGTPSVVYSIPGFRDSVVHERTGLLTRPEPSFLAAAARRLLDDPSLYESLRRQGQRLTAELSWGRTAAVFEATALSVVRAG